MKNARAALALCVLALAASCAGRADGPWATSWTAPLYEAGAPAEDLSERTVRNTVVAAAGGRKARVTLSNRDGETPLFIGSASIGRSAAGAALHEDTVRVLTFSGHPSIMVAPGGEIVSDAVDFAVEEGTLVAVSLYLAEAPGAAPRASPERGWVSREGDFTLSETAAPFEGQAGAPMFVSHIEVAGRARRRN